MRLSCSVRLFLPRGGEEIKEAVLTNEPPESADREPVLLVDGQPYDGRYEVIAAMVV